MPARSSQAVWKGDLKGGSGSMKLASGAYEGAYSYASRFEDGTGTNPEELIGAAHAGCFAMAVANNLSQKGGKVNSIDVTSTVHLGKTDAGSAITHIDVVLKGDVDGIDEATFKAAVDAGCIVSRALAAVPINVESSLV